MQALGDEFWFMRHGMTPSNDADIIAGFTDEPLTPQGRALAAAQAQKLRGITPGSLWVSTLARARETAEAVGQVTGAPLFFLDALRERNWGVLEGRPRGELRREQKPEGGEGPEEFEARIRAGLSGITGPGPVMIVAHSGTARVLFSALGLAFERPGNCDILHFRRISGCHWNVMKL